MKGSHLILGSKLSSLNKILLFSKKVNFILSNVDIIKFLNNYAGTYCMYCSIPMLLFCYIYIDPTCNELENFKSFAIIMYPLFMTKNCFTLKCFTT